MRQSEPICVTYPRGGVAGNRPAGEKQAGCGVSGDFRESWHCIGRSLVVCISDDVLKGGAGL